jgi:hypothetical protein
MSKWIEILKPGTFKDTAGREHVFTMDRLRGIERKFNEQTNEAPLVVGHPEMNSPAFGWAKKLKIVDDRLKALPHQVVPEFADAVNRGIYKYVSVSLRPDDSLRHIGFLGGMPPAVKGLAPVMFSEDPGAITIDFTDGDLNLSESTFVVRRLQGVGWVLQRLRDMLIEKYDLETANKTIGQYDIDMLKEEPRPDPEEEVTSAPAAFSESIAPDRGKEDKSMAKENEKPATPGAEKPAEFAELQSENAALRQENEALKRGQVEGEVRNFVDKAKADGKLLPKFARGITEILVSLKTAGGPEINFSETEKKPAAELLMNFVESLASQLPLKEVAGNSGVQDESRSDFADVPTDPERLELHNKANALKEKEKIPYADAVRRVMKGGN